MEGRAQKTKSQFAGSLPYILLSLTMLLWAGNFVVGRGVREDVPPIALTFWRWALAGALLLPLAWPDLRRSGAHVLAHWRLLLALSVTGVVGYNALLYTGLRETTAINASLMLSATPVLIALASQVVLRQRGSVRQWTGIILSLCGVVVIVTQGALASISGIRLNSGDGWVIIAVVIWAAFTILLTRRPATISPILTQFVITIAGVLILVPAYSWELSAGRTIVFGAESMLAIAYTGILASVIPYILWNRAVSDVGPTRAGLFLHLIPVFSVCLSTVFLGESLGMYHLAGAVLIFSGLALAARSSGSPRIAARADPTT